MKKLFKKVNTKSSRSVVFGLLLAVLVAFGASAVRAQVSNVQPFITDTSDLVSRIGSLSIGSSVVPDWIINTSNCIDSQTLPFIFNEPTIQTCLNVNGLGSFSNILVNQLVSTESFISGNPTLPSTTSFDSARPLEPNFIIKADGTSMMVGGLVYPDPATFSPRDANTSKRPICSDVNGKIVIC